jgi:hypothetical protein
LTKAIKSIDLDSVILNVTKGNNSGVHFVRRSVERRILDKQSCQATV